MQHFLSTGRSANFLLILTIIVSCAQISNGVLISKLNETSFLNKSDSSSGSIGRNHDNHQEEIEENDELDSLFKNDKFFQDFDEEHQHDHDDTKSSYTTTTERLTKTLPTTISVNETLTPIDKGKFDLIQNIINPNPSIIPTTTVAKNKNCSVHSKSILDSANSGFTSILDSLGGLVGFSTQQHAVLPVIMILVAGATGIFWSFVFGYIYTYFFKGGGIFGGNEALDNGGGGSNYNKGSYFDDFFDKFKGKKKYQNNQVNPSYGTYGQQHYGRSSVRNTNWDWNYYTNILTNLVTIGIENLTDMYEVKNGS